MVTGTREVVEDGQRQVQAAFWSRIALAYGWVEPGDFIGEVVSGRILSLRLYIDGDVYQVFPEVEKQILWERAIGRHPSREGRCENFELREDIQVGFINMEAVSS